MATPISERLAGVLKKIGVVVTDEAPSPQCDPPPGPGFCAARGECYCIAVLDNQATAGGLTDARLEKAAKTMTDDAMTHGCSVVSEAT